MAHRIVIDYYDDGSISIARFPSHRTGTAQLELGIDAYYDMEEEWQHPQPEIFLKERAVHYG